MTCVVHILFKCYSGKARLCSSLTYRTYSKAIERVFASSVLIKATMAKARKAITTPKLFLLGFGTGLCNSRLSVSVLLLKISRSLSPAT